MYRLNRPPRPQRHAWPAYDSEHLHSRPRSRGWRRPPFRLPPRRQAVGFAGLAEWAPAAVHHGDPGPFLPLVGKPDYGTAENAFGAARSGHTHEGQDIFAPAGTPEVAPVDAVVAETGSDGGQGNYVYLYDSKRDRTYVYMHMISPSPREVGERVKAGELRRPARLHRVVLGRSPALRGPRRQGDRGHRARPDAAARGLEAAGQAPLIARPTARILSAAHGAHPQLLDHRPHRPRKVDARRPHPRAHRVGRLARSHAPAARLDGPRARARDHDQGAGGAGRLRRRRRRRPTTCT